MSTRLRGLLVKEFIQFLRDRVMLFLILWLYTVEVVICAYALSFDIKDLPLAVVDQDHSPASRALAEAFRTTQVFTTAGAPASVQEAVNWLELGRARVALIIPHDFQRTLERGIAPTIQLLLDGTNSNTAAQARSYALEIVARTQALLFRDHETPVGPIPVVRIWYNPDLSYTTFMVLSMIGLAALMVGVIHPAASIVREKEAGTIEQLRVTPVRVQELFVAKTAPTLLIGLASVFPSLLIVWWFGVPFRGSLFLFLALTGLFLLSAIGLGVLIGAATRTLQQALLLSFFGLFPMLFLSGTIVPVESMPAGLQLLSTLSPLRHYMDVILGVFLKGAEISDLWGQTVALLTIGAPLFLIAGLIFRKTWR